MAYNTTIFGQMIHFILRLDFKSIVNQYNGDHRIRKFSCWDQFIFLLFGQFSKRESLRETVLSINSIQSKLYHLGCKSVRRSTFSDANNKRPYQIYQDLFYRLLSQTQKIAPKHKIKLKRKLYILDATTIDLCLTLFPWARFRKTKSAVRLHTLMQADGSLPIFLNITDGKVHESQAAKSMPIPKGSYLAIDRGYHDFEQYNIYINNNIRFVTRMKTNAKYQVVKSYQINSNSPVLSDEIIEFVGYCTHKKCPHPLRKIHYFDKEQNKEIIFLTNDLETKAQTIAEIYKARWDIELFFKTIKQNLKIKRFFGTTRNAVLTQIWIAMIAYLMVSFFKFLYKTKLSIQQLFRVIQINIFERKSLKDLIVNKIIKPPGVKNELQICLFKI
jgi:plasmid maintenance system killer protein